jgi:hypothetical protein
MTRASALILAAGLGVAPLAVTPAPAAASDVSVTLSGSRASMLRQNRIARDESFTFLRTTAQIRAYVENGYLVPVPGNADYAVIAGHPYARPVVRQFVERLGSDYRAACGERLVVTSLTRPSTRQPRNASPLSVHPAGMAVDLRYPANPTCRSWLAGELLRLEQAGVLDATLERNPPHFHVAVFPAPYELHEQRIAGDSISAEAVRLLEEAVAARAAADDAAAAGSAEAGDEARTVAPALVRLAAWLARLVLPVAAV